MHCLIKNSLATGKCTFQLLYTTDYGSHLTLPYNRSGSTKGQHLYCLRRNISSDGKYPISSQSPKIDKGFTIYWHSVNFGYVRQTRSKSFFLPLPGGCIRNLNKIGQVVSKEMFFETVDRQCQVNFCQGHQLPLTSRIS